MWTKILSSISKFLLRNWYYVAIALLSIFLYSSINSNRKASVEIERLNSNIEILESDFVTYQVKMRDIINGKDSIIIRNAAQISALNLTMEEYKKFRQQDLTEIANLKLKVKNVQSGFAVNFETLAPSEKHPYTRILFHLSAILQ